jgi:hypothetical protein|tara:strand:- start:80 stop:1129 length:1050 start_codon:yes stop_codon:yes gene_type:complete
MSWPIKPNKVRKVQMEITNYCNARCSACAREKIVLGKLEPNILGINDNYITYEQFVSWFTKDDWSELRLLDFCGNIDEPTTNPDLEKIIKWILTYEGFDPRLQINIATNGGTRNKAFWKNLGHLSAKYTSPITRQNGGIKRLHVIWGIDGLEDTNHLYRRNVKWEKLQENFRTYIKYGGRATWQFIYFAWNEHQDEEVKQRSIDEGFEKLKWRNTKRGDRGETKPAKKEQFIKDNNKPKGKIVCKACFRPNYFGLETGLFVTNKGHVMPCCWLGTEAKMNDVYKDHGYKYDKNDNVLDGKKSFADILSSEWYSNIMKTIMAETWDACVSHCKENAVEAITDDWNIKQDD